MTPLDTIISPSRTLCGVEGVSKKRVLQHLATLIANDIPTLDADELFRRLIARERLGSTGLGHGIAIPHCRIDNCTGTIGTLLKLAEPIDFDAVDNEPVDLVFALIVPEESHEDHLQTLAALAERFTNPKVVRQLREAQSPEALYEAATAPID